MTTTDDIRARLDGRAPNRSKPDASPGLFDAIDPPSPAQADAARDEALELVATGAGSTWAEAARAWLRGFLEANAEYVPDRDNCQGPQPVERRAWGAVTRWAILGGLIVRDGYAPRLCGHSTPGRKYRSVVWQEGK